MQQTLLFLMMLLFSLSAFASGPIVHNLQNPQNPQSPCDSFINVTYQDKNPKSLSQNNVSAITEDSNDTMRIGFEGAGVNRVDASQRLFGHHKHVPKDNKSLSHNDVRTFFQHTNGSIWLGTVGGGLNASNGPGKGFEHFRYDPSNVQSISNDNVWSIEEGQNGVMWIATDKGLNRFDKKTKQFSQFRHDVNNLNSLSNDEVQVLLVDSKGRLWIGTWGGGLNRFDINAYEHSGTNSYEPYDKRHAKFKRFWHESDDPLSLSDDYVTALFEDSKGQIWIGTATGLNRLEQSTGRFIRFVYDDGNPASISHNHIMSIHEDHAGKLWIATYGGGLNRLDPDTARFVHYREKDGLANDDVYSILQDDNNHLWLSTNLGLSKFDPEHKSFINFDINDGLQSNEFNQNAHLRSQSGELFFGGVNGFNRFFPDKINQSRQPPNVVFTDFSLLNELPTTTYKPVIDPMTTLTLNHRQNAFSVEFSALDFANPMTNQYAYRLEGWDSKWIHTSANNPSATYVDLPAGEYKLTVRVSNAYGNWNLKGSAINITINPPPWLAWWAYTAYFVLLLLMLTFVYFWCNKFHTKSIN